MNEINTVIFWICAAAAILVYGLIIWSLLATRKSKARQEPSFHKNALVEIVWAMVPLLIIIGIAWPAATRLATQSWEAGQLESVSASTEQARDAE